MQDQRMQNLSTSFPVRALVCAYCLVASATQAAPGSTTNLEIDGLFSALRSSNCEFKRNGSWHDAAKASEHLQRKYEYLLKKDLVPNTEAFIERAATQSSMSGDAYLVRCAGQPEVSSKDWFTTQLRRLRKQ